MVSLNSKDNLSYFLNILVILTIGVSTSLLLYFMWIRLSYSVELTDESYYLAMTYRIVNGDIPLKNAWEPQILSALFTAPLLGLYHYITGSYNGCVLFMRQMFFLFDMVFVGIIFILLRKYIPTLIAFLCILPLFFVVPSSLPYLSYNILNMQFAILGYMLILSYMFSDIKGNTLPLYLVFAAIFHALAVMVYPHFLLACFINIGIVYCLTEKQTVLIYKEYKIAPCAIYAATGAIAGIIMLLFLFLWAGGSENIINGIKGILSSNYQEASHVNGSYVMQVFIYPLKSYILSPIFLIYTLPSCVACAFLYYLSYKREWLSWFMYVFIIIGLIIFLPVIEKLNEYGYNLCFLQAHIFCITTIISLLILLKQRKTMSPVFITTIVASMLIVILRSYSSNNHSVIFQFWAFFPSIISLIYALYLKQNKQNTSGKYNKHINILFIAIITIIISGLNLLCFWTYIYRDAPVTQLTSKVSSGIFRGCLTTRERKDAIEVLENEIRDNVPDGKTVMVGNRFPAAYVISEQKIQSYWIEGVMLETYGFKKIDTMVRYNKVTGKLADTVLIIEWDGSPYKVANNDTESHSYLIDNYKLTYMSPSTAMYKLYVYVVK